MYVTVNEEAYKCAAFPLFSLFSNSNSYHQLYMCIHVNIIIPSPVSHIDGVRKCLNCGHQWTYCSYPRWYICVWRAMVEWYWWGKMKKAEKTCLSATLSTTNLHGVTHTWIWAPAVRGQRLTAWAMAPSPITLRFYTSDCTWDNFLMHHFPQ
jgi:hypothetical protein